jgi:lipid-A-disaccharide synthase
VADGSNLKIKSSLSAAIAKSGTITLELAIMGIPMAIVYRVSELSYLMMKNIIKLKYVGLPNILLDKPAVKEFLQHDFKPDKVAHEILAILKDKKYAAVIGADLDRLRVKTADAKKVVVNIAREIIREAAL